MFYTIFYQPIYNLLIFLYNLVPGKDLGVAIILITLVIRLALYPFSQKAIKSQKELQTIQPEIEKIKEKYKDDKEKMAPELMALYKERKINPFSSCLPTLIQLPFLIALYQVFLNGLTKDNSNGALYSFVQNPGQLNIIAFGFINLASKNWIIAILAGVAQFWQSKMLMGKSQQTGMSKIMTNQMIYFMPIFTIVIGGNLPAGLTLYWLFTTLFSILQQYMVLGFKKKTASI
ncbi:MAG: YidC/Oxa1 family membrane protein insertase [Patescibacteria group bacterium]|jgi:YidC/Oxa1 family membrane protein insertase